MNTCKGCFKPNATSAASGYCPACEILRTNNLRIYIMTDDEIRNFDPHTFVASLKTAGFKFDTEECPVKITKPWDKIEMAGGIIWRQWEPPQGGG
jgi:hypothetical protein